MIVLSFLLIFLFLAVFHDAPNLNDQECEQKEHRYKINRFGLWHIF